MEYLYNDRCYTTVRQLHDAIASYCPAVSYGQAISCAPSDTDILITRTDLVTLSQSTYNLIPPQIACDPSLTDLTDFLWQASLILVAGFAIRALIKVAR